MQFYKIIGKEPIKFVVEMGLGACVEEWNSLAQSLKEKGGVLLYERAGIGRSMPSEARRSPKIIADELHELLKHIDYKKR